MLKVFSFELYKTELLNGKNLYSKKMKKWVQPPFFNPDNTIALKTCLRCIKFRNEIPIRLFMAFVLYSIFYILSIKHGSIITPNLSYIIRN